jgi:hypothetical protein
MQRKNTIGPFQNIIHQPLSKYIPNVRKEFINPFQNIGHEPLPKNPPNVKGKLH